MRKYAKVRLSLSDLNFVIKGSKRTCSRLPPFFANSLTRPRTHYATVHQLPMHPLQQTPSRLEKVYMIKRTLWPVAHAHIHQFLPKRFFPSVTSCFVFSPPLLGFSATFCTVHNIVHFRAAREADEITTAANPE